MTAHLHTLNADSTVVVALHSSASSKSQWRALKEQLPDRQRVIALDLPGYGRSSHRAGSVKGLSAIAEPVIAELKKLSAPVHLVGHSFGGAVAIKIALSRPDLVKSLTLFEPAAFQVLQKSSSSDERQLSELKRVGQILNATTSVGHNHVGMKEFIDFWNGAGAWNELPETLQSKLAQCAPVVANDIKRTFTECWALSDLSILAIPTLIMMGMDSPELTQRTATLIAQHIPKAELAILPGLGHMAPVQNPEWVNPRIQQHVARIELAAQQISWPSNVAA